MSGPIITIRRHSRGYSWEVQATAQDGSEESLADTLSEIALADAALQARYGSPAESTEQPTTPVKLNARGRKVLEWLAENPTADFKAMWDQAKPTKGTINWLEANGYIAFDEARDAFVVLRRE